MQSMKILFQLINKFFNKFFFIVFMLSSMNALEINVRPTGHKKIPLLLNILSTSDHDDLNLLAPLIKNDLEFRKQFEVTIKKIPAELKKSDIHALNKEGYPLVLFLSRESEDIAWRLYTTQPVTMVKGKKYKKQGKELRGWAHGIADMVWPFLTGQEGFFSTKIAYCKEEQVSKNKYSKHIYVADYDGSFPQPLITTSSMSVAPRWNKDSQIPLLFYSECTPSNIRLMAVDMNKKKKIVSNFDGMNMFPSFSHDGKKVVYCASRGDGSCHLYYYEKGIFKKITHNEGNNVSPVLSDDGNSIFFCSDFQTGRPQIYCYNMKKNQIERLTDSGYCTAPAYCDKKQLLAYTKIVDGLNQIFLYDIMNKTHKQLTFDQSNKEECCWSACGNLLLFCSRQAGLSRLVMLDLLSQEQRFITSSNDKCSYPAWSMIYNEFPSIT